MCKTEKQLAIDHAKFLLQFGRNKEQAVKESADMFNLNYPRLLQEFNKPQPE